MRFLQQQREDVVATLTTAGLLDDHRDAVRDGRLEAARGISRSIAHRRSTLPPSRLPWPIQALPRNVRPTAAAAHAGAVVGRHEWQPDGKFTSVADLARDAHLPSMQLD